MDYKLNNEDLYQYVEDGWDILLLTKFQIENLPQDVINKRAEYGHDLIGLSDKQIKNIPQDIINKRFENGGSLYQFSNIQIFKIPQNIINDVASKGGSLDYLSMKQIENIPQDIINRRVEHGMDFSYLTTRQLKKLPQSAVKLYIQYSKNRDNLYCIPLQHLKAIPQEALNKRVAKGNINLNDLLPYQLENLSQDSINKYFELGGNLGDLTVDQRNAIPQEIINERVAKNNVDFDKLSSSQRKNLSLSSIISYFSNKGSLEKLTEDQIKVIPQEVINERVAKGNLNLNKLTKSQLKNIPQECINQYVENSTDILKLTYKQLSRVPQKSINKFVENGGNLNNILSEHKFKNVPLECFIKRASNVDKNALLLSFSRKYGIIKKIPKEILISTNKGKEALILFSIGKIKTEDLPLDVFVNYELRKTFLEIARIKILEKFNITCREKRYFDSVPPNVIYTFDKQIQSIYYAIIRRKESAIENILNCSFKKATTSEIQNEFKNVNEEFKSVNEDSNYYKEEGLKQLLSRQEK